MFKVRDCNIEIERGYWHEGAQRCKDNFMRVDINGLVVWFSYKTPICFLHKGEKVARVNEWQTTTGKHLNWVHPDHDTRINGAEFEERLNAILENI